MTPNEFVRAMVKAVYEPTVEGCLSNLQNPPCRPASAQATSLSEWYSRLSAADQVNVRSVVEDAVGLTMFSTFTVLDGVTQIEDTEDKGRLELRFTKGAESVLLNDQEEGEILHDLFNHIVPPR